MTERWREYIQAGVANSGGPIPFALKQWEFLAPITAAIQRSRPSGGRLLDVGCGAGIYSSLLAHHGYGVLGVDEEPRIVALAREMAEYLRATARFEEGSAFDLSRWHGQFDLVFSLGVLEHFEPEVTIQLLREQARCAPVVVVAIPTKHTRLSGPLTDERLYTRREFERLVTQAGLRIRESFVYGDLPTGTATNLGRVLPKVIYRPMRHLLSYGMGLCCVGEAAR
jgi:2-polyprenyl-3-methyl-5-hydroxy-6-metoxy-1,4-benzoquinol methylase